MTILPISSIYKPIQPKKQIKEKIQKSNQNTRRKQIKLLKENRKRFK